MNALIIVDVQKDFCLGRTLAVKDADNIVPVINRLTTSFKFDLVVAVQDWHHPAHGSFASVSKQEVGTEGELNGIKQIWWPDHCVCGSEGAGFHDNLLTGRFNLILRKGYDKSVDSYSAFSDRAGKTTGLAEYLIAQKVEDIYIVGLATDYCVRFTAEDGVKLGFNVIVVPDACRAVNIKPNDGKETIKHLHSIGVKLLDSSTIISSEGVNGNTKG